MTIHPDLIELPAILKTRVVRMVTGFNTVWQI